MQHGLYIDYGNMDTVNVINYLHQPSEYFLSWGSYTTSLISQYHPDTKVVECGKPVVFSAESGSELSKKSRPYISVFLDQKIFNIQNETMLQIVIAYASKIGCEVRVRFHPSINKVEFLNKYPNIRESLYFQDANFVVGHTSSLIYEALALGCKAMRFASEIPAIPMPDDQTFRSLQELEEKVSMHPKLGLEKEYIAATGEASLSRYANFFRSTMPDLIG
jgi:hypothetical protein